MESSTVKVAPSGYYYQGVWQALSGTKVRQFNISAISQCLKGKVVHMHGDSTVRQFFEFLDATLPGLRVFDLHGVANTGPFIALDYPNNILMKFRFHAPPIHNLHPARQEHPQRRCVRLVGQAGLVVIRTGAPRELTLYYGLINSDWQSLQCYKVLRTMFKGLNVHLIDAWEMVLAHHLPHNIHPPRPIIENMINVLLSYTCPQMGS
ncbi:hypothetical protein PFLUV_G00267440 [Perca fluviatilis]|uniref:NXPE C-terminal domain-containing protein n=1 Tax=Perca fluviatilis TaxID=8168 RepID=A0A6A5E0X4_PERFL|nr:hypothetical protein PFLUV_G00267440 [Perca fluviatilis]